MRIPTLTSLATPHLSDSIANLRQRMTQVSEEAVTGRFTDLTRALDGHIGRAMLSQKALDDVAQQRSVLALRETRLDLVQQSLGAIQDAVSGISIRLQSAVGMNDVPSQTLAARDARVSLDQVFAALNARHGERFLFSGDSTATPPLPSSSALLSDIRAIANASPDAAAFDAAIDAYFNDPAGPWQTSIYAGGPVASDSDSILAIDPAITGLMSGLAAIALARPEEGIALFSTDTAALISAGRRLSTGETALVSLRSDRGLVQQQVSDAQKALDTEETILTRSLNAIAARDQYEAASELRELESNLAAAYLLTARLSNLSLLNFLR